MRVKKRNLTLITKNCGFSAHISPKRCKRAHYKREREKKKMCVYVTYNGPFNNTYISFRGWLSDKKNVWTCKLISDFKIFQSFSLSFSLSFHLILAYELNKKFHNEALFRHFRHGWMRRNNFQKFSSFSLSRFIILTRIIHQFGGILHTNLRERETISWNNGSMKNPIPLWRVFFIKRTSNCRLMADGSAECNEKLLKYLLRNLWHFKLTCRTRITLT